MKILFKTIAVWLLLLAAPVQGFAAVAMMCCGPAQQQTTVTHHAGHEMPRHHDAAASMDHADCCRSTSTGHGHDNAATCSSCLAACVSMAIAPPAIAVSSMPGYGSEAIAFRPRVFRSFVSATPERPPQAFPV